MFLKSFNTILILAISLFIITGCSIKEQEVKKPVVIKKKKPELKREPITQELLLNIDRIVYYISTNQRTKLNNMYIHKKLGYFDVYLKKKKTKVQRKFFINSKEKEYNSISKSIIHAKKHAKNLKLERFSPTFNCSPKTDEFYGWNKDGLFLTENIHFPLVSRLVDVKKVDDLKFAKMVDKLSYKVVLSEAEIVFFMTYLENKWYITLFDRASFDCSSD